MVETVHNQTEPAWLEGGLADELGVGIFALPDVESDEKDAVKVVRVHRLSYPECVRRGRHTMAFKWIPATVAAELGLAPRDPLRFIRDYVSRRFGRSRHQTASEFTRLTR